jgi:transcriptional regulator with GAF, ATPase, and Fis domain
MNPESVVSALAEIAETASETLELQEVFNRVAAAVRRLIPFDNIGVVRIIDGQFAVLHATTIDCRVDEAACTGPTPLTAWSPRLRPRPGPIPRIDDAAAELDPSFPLDARIVAGGVRSALWEPFRPAERFSGGVWLSSSTPHLFTDEHQQMLGPIAALLGSAVEHWRIWDGERRQRERLDRLETLLGTLAESLDVREVFGRISEAVQPVLPHQLLVLTEVDNGARAFRVVVFAGDSDAEAPERPVPLSDQEMERLGRDFEIFHDMPAEVRPETERNRLMLATGMRSGIRVPVLMSGEVRGALLCMHREPSRYGPDDVEVVRRVADRIALALSHRELAEKARLAAEARERAERLEAAVASLTRELEAHGRTRVVGVSRSWKEVLRQVGRVAASETTVLIAGESGTGKEVVSRMIHHGSPRAGRPFVAINCAALPEQLLESELFGHEKGAFTGAIAAKPGRVEQAAGGTLFLDEIAEMSPLLQAKFLRLLQEREFQRVGGTRVLRADVRVIAASNRDLAVAIGRGQFREDLYYRLNVFAIDVPPLRARPDDILPLAESFLEELGRSMGRPAAGISRDAREWLLAYPWPGNVRELRNAIERAILLCDGGLITREHLPAAVVRPGASDAWNVGRGGVAGGGPSGAHPAATGSRPGGTPLAGDGLPSDPAGGPLFGRQQVEAMERTFVEKALREAGGNKSKAARLLGLSRAQLYTRMQKYGVN